MPRRRGRGAIQRRGPYPLRNRVPEQLVPEPQRLDPLPVHEQHGPVPELRRPDTEPAAPVVQGVQGPLEQHVPHNHTAVRQGNDSILINNIETCTSVASNEPLLIPMYANETDVFITPNLKEKVWNFEYVDLAQFLKQNFENNVDQRSSNLEIINGKLVLQPRQRKSKSIDSISSWTNAFLNYVSIMIENHPHKAGELIRYITLIRNVAEENPTSRWLLYDQQFRLRISMNPLKSWGSIDGELWLRFIATPFNRATSQTSSKYCCYDYNYKGTCNKFSCNYRHACLKCQMNHPIINCSAGSSKAQQTQNKNSLQKPSHLFKAKQPSK